MDLNLVLAQIDAAIVVEAEKYDLIKASLRFNKLALNVQVLVKKLQIHALIVTAKVISKLQRRFPLLYLKELTTALELDLQEKVRQG